MKITPDSEFMQHERGKQGYLKKCISFCSGQDHAVSRELLVWICHKNLWITHVNQSFSCIAQWLQEDLSKWAFLGKTEMNPCSKNWDQYLHLDLQLDCQRGLKSVIAGGTEQAMMSTTSNIAVAVRYSLSTGSVLFKLQTSSFMDHGAGHCCVCAMLCRYELPSSMLLIYSWSTLFDGPIFYMCFHHI
jgi:hypothetical protein